jgi:hypothetical protein
MPSSFDRSLAAVVAALAAGCSSLPPVTMGTFRDHAVRADFVVPADGRLFLPTSGPTLTIHELVLTPAPLDEQFASAERWFVYPPGTRVVVRARFRSFGAYAHDPTHVLRDAEHVRALPP